MRGPLLVLAALACAAVTACGPSAEDSLKVSPLMQQAIRAFRIGDGEALDALLVRLESLKPAGVPDSEITSCTADGYLLRRIERTRLEIDHLNHPAVLSMGEVGKFVFFEDAMLGDPRLLEGKISGWPTDYQCQKEPGNREVRYYDDAEANASRTYFQKMARSWKTELGEQKGLNTFKLELERASKMLYSNRLRKIDHYGRDADTSGMPNPR